MESYPFLGNCKLSWIGDSTCGSSLLARQFKPLPSILENFNPLIRMDSREYLNFFKDGRFYLRIGMMLNEA